MTDRLISLLSVVIVLSLIIVLQVMMDTEMKDLARGRLPGELVVDNGRLHEGTS